MQIGFGHNIDSYMSFEELKNLIYTDKWPEAVYKQLYCKADNVAEKKERGSAVVELMCDNLRLLKFLDFGCGEGYSTEYAATITTAVGYDVASYDNWNSKIFTTNYADVVKQAPYDVILLFDVIDHLQQESASEVMRKVKNVLSPDGKIFLRAHPYTSRHARHLHHYINKAYLHLIFSKEELSSLIPEQNLALENFGSVFPLRQYDDLFKSVGLKTVSRRDIVEPVEPFFKQGVIAERILKNLNLKELPEFQMSLSFLDYTLTL